MARVNKTQYAILGVLTIAPMSGYDIKKYIETSIGYFWNENYGHLYPILKRLESEGAVTKEKETKESGPDRNIYTITQKGKDKLLDWLSEPPKCTPTRNEMLFKLFFGRLISTDENISRIKKEKEKKMQSLDNLRETEKCLRKTIQEDKTKSKRLKYQLLTVLKGIYTLEADLIWCQECLGILEELED